MKNKIIYIVLATLLLVGCTRENYLDFIPKGVTIPSSIEDYRQMLDQVGEPDGSLLIGFGNMHGRVIYFSDDIILDEDIATGFSYDASLIRAYRFEPLHVLATVEDNNWSGYYAQIYNSNIILDGLGKLENADPAKVAELEAEAKLHRAWAYFNLVNLYSVHYNAATASTDLGVPIREGIELTGVDLTRSSVQAVYDYILDDITSSIGALPPSQGASVRWRPSQAAAHALLSRIYLYQARYQEALDAAEDALAIYSDLNDWNDMQIGTFGDLEYIQDPLEDREILMYKVSNHFATAFMNPEFLDLYDTNDRRRLAYIDWTTIEPDNDLGFANFGRAGVDYNSGLSTAELYLTSAECNARLGNNGAALTRLNAMSSTRWESGTYTDIDISDNDELLTYIKAERRRDMHNTQTRAFDIKRYNLYDGDNITVTHDYDGTIYTLTPNSLNWAFPIGERYIQFNPEIAQNPRD